MFRRPIFLLFAVAGISNAAAGPIFPEPREMQLTANGFALEGASILLPSQASRGDQTLARFLANELSDRWDIQLKQQPVAQMPATGRRILMGAITNPLVREYCARQHIEITAQKPGPEGYVLRVEPNLILIAGSDDRGAFYGLQSLRQLIAKTSSGAEARGAQVTDWPAKPFRGVRMYVPGRANIAFFKRFVRDFMALYKFNKIMVEMNASMRFDRHPELNAGFLEFFRDTQFSRHNYPPDSAHGIQPNSSHQDTADGGFLEKSDVADLAKWARDNYIEFIPEIPSLTHSFYLLSRHKELAEVAGHKWPDTYCPLNPASYKLLFEVLDEYIEVLKPSMIHIGHDEWFSPMDECDRCRGKDWGELFGTDIKKTHDYLAARGIKTAVWGDMFLQGVRGAQPRNKRAPDGFQYRTPGAMTPEQVKRLVPKDVLVFNWFWQNGRAEANEAQLEEFGFKQIYGNLEPMVPNFDQRAKRASIIGGATSYWSATTESNFGKDMMWSVMGSGNILWTGRLMESRALSDVVQSRMPETRRRLAEQLAPSETETVAALDISPSFNTAAIEPTFKVDLSAVKPGEAKTGNLLFNIRDGEGKSVVMVGSEGKQPNPLPRAAEIPIGVDATSLIFLHAAARPATNKLAYLLIWDFDDSADMLGWYEIVYADGFTLTTPIRYGVNILEWNWNAVKTRAGGANYVYAGDPVVLGSGPQGPVQFFAYEWRNPRLGKVIKEVRLKGTTGFRGSISGYDEGFGDVIPNNAVMLKAISYTKARLPVR